MKGIINGLEEKMAEAEEHLPGVGEMLKPVSQGNGGGCYNEHPTDVEYLEIGEHKVVAAKWEARYWNGYGGGVGTTEWAVVYFPGEEGEVEEIVTNKIVTRDQRDARFDKHDLMYHDCIGLEALADDIVEVAWLDKDGKKGPTYTIKLE